MDAIILAAGYGTRLYPLTKNTPKPLLKVAGKAIIEHIINKLDALDVCEECINDKEPNPFRNHRTDNKDNSV